MRSSAVLAAIIALLPAPPLAAQEIVYETVEVSVDTSSPTDGGERILSLPSAPIPEGVASYGPFRVLDAGRAALVDTTDAASPSHFAAMLRDHPGIALIEMIECPGTEDDLANMRLGRMIRERGIATLVPRGGSVRSGGVELFLAGARRYAEPGAEFAVHSWLDDDGREASDFAADAPVNRRYIAYYRQMGLSEAQATAFYAMTNSVPFDSALWLDGDDMARFVALDSKSDDVPTSLWAAQSLDSNLRLQ